MSSYVLAVMCKQDVLCLQAECTPVIRVYCVRRDSPTRSKLLFVHMVFEGLLCIDCHMCIVFAGTALHSVDSLTFETLIPRPIMQRYVSLLLEHRRIILCGPSGTGKTYLAQKLAEHVVIRCETSIKSQ